MPQGTGARGNGGGGSAAKILSWKRGRVWDYLAVVSKITNIDLANSHALVSKPPLKYGGDATYTMFQGTQLRVTQALRVADSRLSLEVDRALTDLGIKRNQMHKQTSYYGRLIDFAWHNSAIKGGTYFMPIYHQIEQQIKRKPKFERDLTTIRRRLVYLEILGDELGSLDEIYDFRTIPILSEWTACLLEIFLSKAAEITLLMAEYHSGRELKFEELSGVLSKTHKVFSSINSALEGFFLVALRNRVVHTAAFQLELAQGHPEVLVTLDRKDKPEKFGVLLDYVKAEVSTCASATKVGIERRGKVSYHLFKDNRFPYVTFKLRRSKSGTFPVDDAEFRYRLSPKKAVDLESSFLFQAGRFLFS